MNGYKTERKLAAVFIADLVSYSSLMEADETATLAGLRKIRGEIIDPFVDLHHGRIVKSLGDGILAEFASVVDAVKCAISIQQTLAGSNAAASKDRPMRLRIGINLGDVVEEDGDLFGDGVNIAARLEKISDPDGICISGTVFDQVRSKVPVGYRNLGEIRVRNISQPVRTYKVLLDPAYRGKTIGVPIWRRPALRRFAYTLGALCILLAGGLYWLWPVGREYPSAFSEKYMPQPAQASIAVLPFRNISADASQDGFVSGLTADLISSLSRIPELLVISPYSTSKFKSDQADIPGIARDLGVENILTGSVQKSEDRIRVVVRLSKGENGAAIWSNRYDREISDFFALQDDIIKNVIVELQANLTVGDSVRGESKGTDSLEAWLLTVQAQRAGFEFERESNLRARNLFEAAARADPDWPLPLAGLSWTYREAIRRGWSADPEADRKRGIELALKVLEMDSAEPQGYIQLGNHYIESGRLDEGIALREKALQLAPSDLSAITGLAWQVFLAGDTNRGLELYQRAKRISPIHPWWIPGTEAIMQQFAGNLDAAIGLFAEAGRLSENAIIDGRIAAAYAEAGNMEMARLHTAAYLAKKPDGNVSDLVRVLRFQDRSRIDRYAELLKKAGIPE